MDASANAALQATSDTCRYALHLSTSSSTGSSPSWSSSLERLQAVHAEILAYVHTLTHNYIWHKQPFNLEPQIKPGTSSSSLSTLSGSSDVTDAIDDEWFLVWILRQVSIKVPQVVIQVEDDDGQFLLIEAAQVLPKWITPDNALNRVWIHQGRLHLVPLQHTSSIPFDPKATPSLEDDPESQAFIDHTTAIELVQDPNVDTLAPKEVEELVWARIEGYPDKVQQHLHKSLAYLPLDIVLALEDSPSLIAEAVAAFYEREPDTLKPCNTMHRFPPTSPTQAFLETPPTETPISVATSLPSTTLYSTTLTRPLYSQLVMQKFFPPKPFDRVGWEREPFFGQGDKRRRNVGMKIACGFEILYASSSKHNPILNPTLEQPTPSDRRFQLYLTSLQTQGFFHPHPPGSEEYELLESQARQAYSRAKRTSSPSFDSEISDFRTSFAQRVEEAISRTRSRIQCFGSSRIEKKVLRKRVEEDVVRDWGLEDSEHWLGLDQDGLEELLRGKAGFEGEDEEMFGSSDDDDDEEEEDGEREGGKMKVDFGEVSMDKEEQRRAKKAARKLGRMAGQVEKFLEGKGSVQGATFEDEESDEDDGEHEDDEDGEGEAMVMSEEEKKRRLASLVKGLEESEWGAKTIEKETPSKAEAGSKAKDTIDVPPKTNAARAPQLTRNKYDGASESDDSSDDEEEGQEGLGGSLPGMNEDLTGREGDQGEDAPAVEMDMEEEMDEFLKFATETLGLTPEQYEDILKERKGRGAFVPGPSKAKKVNLIPSLPEGASSIPKDGASKTKAPKLTVPTPALRNPNLSNFDALMQQMDSELAKVKRQTPTGPSESSAPKTKPTPKPKPGPTTSKEKDSSRIVIDSDSDMDSEDDVGEMDAELATLFHQMSGTDAERDPGPLDLNLVKNFLESFQNQGGFAGPAGTLSGRLGYQLPRKMKDDDAEA
ncbi:BQ5605_C004g02676 [Microbotryum silenes-dioicae]|uniref:BQ5605_C004g02676 protein n=1 Tax=Microbotryum silenes-dioicae TaxID=796604 RepID=A0A2X0PAK8_9BASI|nr:BQ5605_C004g02676 [Microbotryum silenes-dioicae]